MNGVTKTIKVNATTPYTYIRFLSNSPDNPGPCDDYLRWSNKIIKGNQTTIDIKGMVIK